MPTYIFRTPSNEKIAVDTSIYSLYRDIITVEDLKFLFTSKERLYSTDIFELAFFNKQKQKEILNHDMKLCDLQINEYLVIHVEAPKKKLETVVEIEDDKEEVEYKEVEDDKEKVEKVEKVEKEIFEDIEIEKEIFEDIEIEKEKVEKVEDDKEKVEDDKEKVEEKVEEDKEKVEKVEGDKEKVVEDDKEKVEYKDKEKVEKKFCLIC